MEDFDVENELQKVFHLEKNCRILAARLVYDNIIQTVKIKNIETDIIEKNSDFFETLLIRSDEMTNTIKDCSSVSEDWILGWEYLNVRTYYKFEEDGLMSIRMEGIQDIPIFEQISVLYECALYSEWIPFCSYSACVLQKCKCDICFISKY